MAHRTWIFVLVGAFLGAAIGLVYVLVYDPLCMCPAIAGPCGCTHDEIFGWQPGALAVPIWTAIAVAGGGIAGLAADRVTHR